MTEAQMRRALEVMTSTLGAMRDLMKRHEASIAACEGTLVALAEKVTKLEVGPVRRSGKQWELVLRQMPQPFTTRDFAAKQGTTPNSARQVLDRLLDMGVLRRVSRGVYELVD